MLGDAGGCKGCRKTYRPEPPKGAKDEVKRPFLPFLPILHCRGAKPAAAKPAAAKPAASKADYSRPRQTMADQNILNSAVLPASPMPLFWLTLTNTNLRRAGLSIQTTLALQESFTEVATKTNFSSFSVSSHPDYNRVHILRLYDLDFCSALLR